MAVVANKELARSHSDSIVWDRDGHGRKAYIVKTEIMTWFDGIHSFWLGPKVLQFEPFQPTFLLNGTTITGRVWIIALKPFASVENLLENLFITTPTPVLHVYGKAPC